MVANASGRTLTTSRMQVQNPTSLWRVERVDGVREYYTNHDEDIETTIIDFLENDSGGVVQSTAVIVPGGSTKTTFFATTGLTASASRREAGRSETRNVIGVVDGISQTHLEGGRYEMAEVTEWVVDSRWPFLPWFQRNTYWITGVGYSDTSFDFSMEGLGQRLRENHGNQFSRTCRYTLGRDEHGVAGLGCGRNRSGQPDGINLLIANFTSTGAVVTHVAEGTGTDSRVSFNVDKNLNPSGTISSGRPYKYGRIIWTVGNNAGLEYEIGDYTTNVAPLGSTGQFSSQTQTENVIEVGDECTIEEGCDNTFFTCNGVYGNKLNFGGWNLIPGPTKSRQAPRKLW